jgi:hypothetical protein
MLIAVTLVALMAVGLWAVFTISIRSWSRGTQFIDANQRHRSILDMVRKQLASAYGLYGEAEQEETEQGTPSTSVLIFSGAQDSLRFISLNSLQFQESPGLTLVSYEVARDPEGDYALVEKEARYLGQAPGEEIAVIQNRAIPIFENLSSCIFEYFDPGSGDNPPRWVREWNAQDMGQLPLAVSMTMISRGRDGKSLSRHMVVPIQAKVSNYRRNVMNPFGGGRGVMQ